MNGSKALSNFPPEIWASIGNFLTGEQLGRLKLTGSKRLWHKMCCLMSVLTVTLGMDFLIFKRWPAFLNELPSVKEMIIQNSHTIWWESFQPKLVHMPKTLTKLVLKVRETCLPSFFIQSDGSLLWLDELVPLLEYLSINLDWSSEHTWMSRMPPGLTSLRFLEYMLPMALPSSLKHIKASSITIDAIHPNIPPNLESIKAEYVYGLDELIPRLPPSFHTFCVVQFREKGTFASSKLLGQFPKQMVSLENLEFSRFFEDDEDEDHQLPLPPNLTNLRATRIPQRLWKDFPTTLQSLSLRVESTPLATILYKNPLDEHRTSNLRTYPINTLPRNVTKLHLNFKLGFFLAAPEYLPNAVPWFPPHLITLHVESQLSIETVKHLPKTLTELTTCNVDKTIVQHFPRGLKILVARHVILSAELIKFLPRSLTSLVLRNATLGTAWTNPAQGTGTMLYVIPKDPKSGIEYSNSSINSSMKLAQPLDLEVVFDGVETCLPSSLTHLFLENFKFDDSFILQQRLSCLRELMINNGADFSDAVVPLLSRHLNTLWLPKSAKLSGKCFVNLPRNLIWLELGGENVVDEDIQHLPRTLNYLTLKRNTLLTCKCAKHLPRSLETFYIDANGLFSEDAIADLPTPLKSPMAALNPSISTSKWQISQGVCKQI